MLDFEDDSVDGGFSITPSTALYRAEVNDPQLSNASQTQAVFEFNHTFNYWTNLAGKQNQVNFRLAKCILLNDTIPNDLISATPSKLFQKLSEEINQ